MTTGKAYWYIIQDIQQSSKPNVREGWELHRKGCKDAIKNATRYKAETVAGGATVAHAIADLLDGELTELGFNQEDVRIPPCAATKPSCRCCGKPTWHRDPIHTRCIVPHWDQHSRGNRASRCLEFKNRS